MRTEIYTENSTKFTQKRDSIAKAHTVLYLAYKNAKNIQISLKVTPAKPSKGLACLFQAVILVDGGEPRPHAVYSTGLAEPGFRL